MRNCFPIRDGFAGGCYAPPTFPGCATRGGTLDHLGSKVRIKHNAAKHCVCLRGISQTMRYSIVVFQFACCFQQLNLWTTHPSSEARRGFRFGYPLLSTEVVGSFYPAVANFRQRPSLLPCGLGFRTCGVLSPSVTHDLGLLVLILIFR